ncbi:MAG TPA: tetratricopeptide repeat protein [Oligoflexia bacterium]|nr:tetratricopeptide repeat protein [Oligoflexia bacterium]HMP47604.1 tetratricopeptide repeat protein [Oligoflexia bacterium]
MSKSVFSGSIDSGAHDSENLSIVSIDLEESEARYYFLTSELLLRQEKFDQGLLMLEKADSLVKNPSPTILKRLVQLYLRAGKLAEALNVSERLVAIAPDSTEALQLKAGTLGALGRIDEAIISYQELLEKQNPPQEEAYLLLAGLLVQNNRVNEAVSVFRELMVKLPESFIAHYYLAKLYLSLGDKQASIDFYGKALKLNPAAEQVELELIQVLAMNRQIEAATRRCQQLVNRSPNNARARQLLAELLLGDKKIEQALSALEDAKSIGTGGDDIALKVALIKLGKKDYEGAESELNILVQKNPENHEARYYLATAYASQGQIEDATQSLMQISPKSELYKKGRGFAAFLLRQEGEFSRALSIVDEALGKYPDDIELLSYKTSIERESGDLHASIETLRKISNIEKSNEQHLFNLAVAIDEIADSDSKNGNSRHKEEVLKLMSKVIELNPSHANALNYIAYSLAETGKDLERAEELVLRAISLEPDNGYFIDTLGWIYYQSGKYQKALIRLERANELVPSDPVILEHLGRAYLKLDRAAEARRTLERSYELLRSDEKQEKLMIEIRELLDSLK